MYFVAAVYILNIPSVLWCYRLVDEWRQEEQFRFPTDLEDSWNFWHDKSICAEVSGEGIWVLKIW